MPSIKRSGVKSTEAKTGFESYDGPEPSKRGMYRGVVKQFNYKEFGTGATGFAILLELEAQKGDPKDHAQFDGYPIWTNVVFGDKEAMIARESNLYAGLGVKDEPAVVFEDGDATRGVKVTKIGGKNPIGAVLNADIKLATRAGYEGTPEIDGLYKFKDIASTKAASAAYEDEDEDLLEDDEDGEEGEETQTREEREEELTALGIPALRKLAKEDYDLKTTGLKKDGLVELILDHEFDAAALAEDEDAEDEEEEDAEVEEADDDEEEEDDDDEEEDDDEDDDSERRAELEAMDRTALKAELKGLDPSFKVLKRHTDADLVEAILSTESETPF